VVPLCHRCPRRKLLQTNVRRAQSCRIVVGGGSLPARCRQHVGGTRLFQWQRNERQGNGIYSFAEHSSALGPGRRRIWGIAAAMPYRDQLAGGTAALPGGATLDFGLWTL